MTIQRSIEEIRQVFPDIGVTQVINDLDKAQKDFCLEINLLTTSMALTSISTTVKFTLPTDFNAIIELLAYDVNGMPILLNNYRLAFSVDDTYLYVYRTDSVIITGIPAAINSLYLKYKAKPTALTTITSTYSVSDEFKGGVEAVVYKKYYGLFPVDVRTRTGEIIKSRDSNMYRVWSNEVKEYQLKAKRYVNSCKDERPFNVINYGMAGNFAILKNPR